ncbi:unnamed protein product [Sphagnum tenellum]
MGDQLVVEASAVEVEDFSSHFFDRLPTDLRCEKIVFESFKPLGNFDNDSLSFTLPKLNGNNMYRLHEALLLVNVRLTDQDGNTPPVGTDVSTLNNVMYSLFKEVEITLNTYKMRAQRFGKSMDDKKKITFRDDAVPFMGKLLHDITKDSCDILNGIEVSIRMHYSSDAFRIIAAGDALNKKWKLSIKDALLHVPVATLNHELFTKIEKR